MKLRDIANIFAVFMVLIVTSCDPIEDRDMLSNSFNPDNIELEVIQSTEGGNGLTLKMNTPGVTGYWDYNIATKFSDQVEVNYPIPGAATFTYYVTTPYMTNGQPSEVEYIAKTIDVQIDVLDQALPDAYYNLVGSELEGRSWEFAGNVLTWYMCPGDDKTQWQSAWWDAGECCPPDDFNGKMRFDLDGAANYSYSASADGDLAKSGSFSFNIDYTKLYVTGDDKILGNTDDRGNADGEYQIVSLTSEELILYVPTNGGGTGWVWKFRPVSE